MKYFLTLSCLIILLGCLGMGHIGKPAPSLSGPVTKSLLFNRNVSNWLSMSAVNFGTNWNHRLFTWFVCGKRTSTGVHSFAFAQSIGDPNQAPWSFFGDISPSDQAEMEIFNLSGTNTYGKLESTTTYTSTTAFQTLQFDVNLDASDQTNRMVMTFNGTRVTNFGTTQWPDGVTDVYTDQADPMTIGGNSLAANGGSEHYWWPGNLCWMAFFSGRNPANSELVDGNNKPKDLAGVPNLYSLIRGDESVIGTDEVITHAWSNNSGNPNDGLTPITTSSSVP